MYGSYGLQNYHKQLGRLFLDGNIVRRKFYDHSGRKFIKQIAIPKQLRTELIHRIHNTKLKGHQGIQKTFHEFRRKFYFPGYTEFLITYIKNCLTCLQAKSPKMESHGPLKRYLQIYENKQPRDWHKYLDLAVFRHNTSYHSTIACPPTLIFHGRIPQNPLDLRFSNKIYTTSNANMTLLPICEAKWRNYSVKPEKT